MRHCAGRDRVDDVLAGAAEPAAEPLVDVARERAGLDAVEELVADPVRLDDARVERVGDAVRAGDQLRYGHAPSKVRASSARPPSDAPRVAVLEQRPRLVGAAEAERVRRVRVAREEERPGGHVGRPRAGRRAGERELRRARRRPRRARCRRRSTGRAVGRAREAAR